MYSFHENQFRWKTELKTKQTRLRKYGKICQKSKKVSIKTYILFCLWTLGKAISRFSI